jgi:hypothetical protein
MIFDNAYYARIVCLSHTLRHAVEHLESAGARVDPALYDQLHYAYYLQLTKAAGEIAYLRDLGTFNAANLPDVLAWARDRRSSVQRDITLLHELRESMAPGATATGTDRALYDAMLKTHAEILSEWQGHVQDIERCLARGAKSNAPWWRIGDRGRVRRQ